jgi:hypothetical protein
MNKRSERIFSDGDEAEMRAFYASCGISRDTTDAAINTRRNNKPVEQDNQKVPLKGKKRKAARPVT